MKRLLIVILALGLAAVAGVGFWIRHQLVTPASDKPAVVTFVVQKGMPPERLAAALEAKGLIRNKLFFVWLARLSGKVKRIHHGTHKLRADMTAPQVLEALTKPAKRAAHKVVIPEGKSVWEVADILHTAGVADRLKFIRLAFDPVFVKSLGLTGTSVEGFLFPDTYDMPLNFGPQKAIALMVQKFNQVYAKLASLPRAEKLGLRKVVILASIVEKEAGKPKTEKAAIAAVIHNRLAKGMRLEMDPTVIYGIMIQRNQRLLQAKLGGAVNFVTPKGFNLTKNDLVAPTPYNTYTQDGLPPGPIASPGLASIKAVLDPAPVDYLYFVSRNDGSHHFSSTLREHQNAVNKYQRKRPR